jgi:hypothetical protein
MLVLFDGGVLLYGIFSLDTGLTSCVILSSDELWRTSVAEYRFVSERPQTISDLSLGKAIIHSQSSKSLMMR